MCARQNLVAPAGVLGAGESSGPTCPSPGERHLASSIIQKQSGFGTWMLQKRSVPVGPRTTQGEAAPIIAGRSKPAVEKVQRESQLNVY